MELLQRDISLYRKMSHIAHADEYDVSYTVKSNWQVLQLLAEEYFKIFPADYLKKCYNESHNRYVKTVRVRKRIHTMMSSGNPCKFLTLTFRDDVFQSTDEKTRRTYVSRWLKANCLSYVGNLDFGKEKGREHYHAFVTVSGKCASNWPYGFMKIKSVKTDAAADARAKYQNKLSFHATKFKSNLIYSRDTIDI